VEEVYVLDTYSVVFPVKPVISSGDSSLDFCVSKALECMGCTTYLTETLVAWAFNLAKNPSSMSVFPLALTFCVFTAGSSSSPSASALALAAVFFGRLEVVLQVSARLRLTEADAGVSPALLGLEDHLFG